MSCHSSPFYFIASGSRYTNFGTHFAFLLFLLLQRRKATTAAAMTASGMSVPSRMAVRSDDVVGVSVVFHPPSVTVVSVARSASMVEPDQAPLDRGDSIKDLVIGSGCGDDAEGKVAGGSSGAAVVATVVVVSGVVLVVIVVVTVVEDVVSGVIVVVRASDEMAVGTVSTSATVVSGISVASSSVTGTSVASSVALPPASTASTTRSSDSLSAIVSFVSIPRAMRSQSS